MTLEGKRVLLIAPRFFGYDEEIAAELRASGASVCRLVDRPFGTPVMAAATKLAPEVVARLALPRYVEDLDGFSGCFDYLFVINGQTISPEFLKYFRRSNPNARMVLYIWDSLANRPSIRKSLDLYDRVLGFERGDANKFGFLYRPLFFVRAFSQVGQVDESLDISFAGTAHSDRAQIVSSIENDLPPSVRREWFLYLQAPWVRLAYSARSPTFARVPKAMFSYKPRPKSEIAILFAKSRAILDIEHPMQRGLTMRTFEALGAGKKLVTTNGHIRDEEFYDARRMHILDRSAPRIPSRFLEDPVDPVPQDILARFSITGWMADIFEAER